METQKSIIQSSSSWSNLPQEIITEILLRLPVKSLLRFRCVSKSWLSLISSAQFRKTHLKISTENNNYAHKTIIFGSRASPAVFHTCSLYPYPKVDEDHSMDTVSFDYPSVGPDDVIGIVGSCNGLICVDVDPFDGVILWNPATRKYRKLPVLGDEIFSASYGFGYDAFNDDYKVVKFSLIYVSLAECSTKLHIYSLRNDSWKTVEWSCGNISNDRGVFVRGAIHWIVYDDDVSHWDLVAQNLTTENCSSFALPEHRLVSEVEVTLGVCVGLLCAFHDHLSYMDIWVMKEYGVKESWNIMISFSYFFRGRHLYHVRPEVLFVWENGGILLCLGSNLIMYKQSQYHEAYRLGDDGSEVEATTFIASFVSPDFDCMWS